jgi:hypothetical protein
MLLLSPSKISRIENAQRSISARDVRDLLNIYRVTDSTVRDELMRLSEESRESAWWARYGVDPGYSRLIGLEGAAKTICDYQIGGVPGLLQTPDYAAAVIGPWGGDRISIKNSIDVRMSRQEKIGANTSLKFVVDESVLHRPFGGREVMRRQLQKIIEMTSDSRVEFQVLPYSSQAHQGVVGGFIILQLPDSTSTGNLAPVSDVVYLEDAIGSSAYIENPDDVSSYLRIFRGLQERALDRQATISLLTETLRRM